MPLPPLNEQLNIVDKVESLVNKINQAKQLIEEAKETFELRRAAILDKAFRGELTTIWRCNQAGLRKEYMLGKDEDSSSYPEGYVYPLPTGWNWMKFSDVSTIMSNLVDPSGYSDYPHVAPDNIQRNTGVLLDYVSIKESGVKSPKHLFSEGQIIYSKIRPYLSKVIIAPFDGLCSADMYPISTRLDTNYLFLFMLSPYFLEKASTAGSRSVLPKINQKELSNIMVPVCSLNEQKEIILITNDLLLKNNESLNQIKETEEFLDVLQQSILVKAFSGQLGTSDSGNALELTKELLNSLN